jgi:hypothetical protein
MSSITQSKQNSKLWTKNPETNRYVKIDGKTHKKLSGEKLDKDMSKLFLNPNTNRWIKIGGKVYNELMKDDSKYVSEDDSDDTEFDSE